MIVQDERLGIITSFTVCGLTSDHVQAPIYRVLITPSELNQLRVPSYVMVDKVTTISATKLGYRIGRLDDNDVTRVNHALMMHLGLPR